MIIKNILYITTPKEEFMLRRPLNLTSELENRESRACKKSNSNSTQDGREHSVDVKGNKLKSQLCKKFMENGYCPYEKRCKFAHGLIELRKNNQYNSKYKTKECGSFKNNHFCIYGDRCNFIHITDLDAPARPAKEDALDVPLELIRSVAQKESKLLRLLF
jgi:hypothetical protein